MKLAQAFIRAAVAAAIVTSGLVYGQGTSGLTISGYKDVGEQRLTHTQQYVTYTANVTNSGPAVSGLTATVTSTSPAIQVVAGRNTIHFPPVPASGVATSSDTFTILIDTTQSFSLSSLQWSFLNPVASAGFNQTVALGTTVTLNGSGSFNPAGGPLTYSWSFTSKPSGSSAVLSNPASVLPSFTADVAGAYVIGLTVSTGTASANASVTVSTINSPPVAIAGPNQTASVGNQVTLDGSDSFDVDGTPITYFWSLISNPIGSQAVLANFDTVSPSFTPDLAGIYVLQLVVSDGQLSSNPSIVIVTSANAPPVANAGPAQFVAVGSQVRLNGAGSTDLNGNLLTFRWSLLSVPAGSNATLSAPTSVNPAFTADVPGTYVAQLIVNDGVIDSTPATVTISTNTVLAPTANAGPAQTVIAGAPVTLNGSASDPQKLPLTLKWALISEPAGSAATLSSTTQASTGFTTDQPGTYVAQLIASNPYLSSVPSTVAVTTTANTLPVANPGSPQTVAAGAGVNLDGTGSSDANNLPLAYTWSLISVPAGSTAALLGASTPTPFFNTDIAGPYVVQLIVNDGLNNSVPATVLITATAPGIALTPNPLSVTGSSGTLTVTLNAPAPAATTVSFSGYDPTVISLPSSLTVAANTSTAKATVTPLTAGSTNVTASANGFQSGTASVVVPAALSLSPKPFTINGRATQNLIITLSRPAPAGGLVVNLSASPATIVSLPATATIAANTTTATVAVTGQAAGTTVITAGASPSYITGATLGVTVQSPGTIGLPSGVSVMPGQSVPFAVTLPSPAPQPITVALSSSALANVTVSPASVTIATGQTQPATQPQVTGVNFGSASIRAAASTYLTGSQTVQVGASMTITPTPISITGTTTQNATLTLSAPAPAALTVNLSASPTGVVSVPASVTIAKNATTAPLPITGVSVGGTTITATATAPNIPNATAAVTVQSGNAILLPANVTIAPAQSTTFAVTLPSAATQQVTVNLASGDTSKITISPASVTIAAGQTQPATQPTITGVNFGSAAITASATGFNTGSQLVNVGATLSFTPAAPSVTGTATQNVTLTLSAAAPAPVTVNLAATPSGIVSVPASVTIPQNGTTAIVPITGVSVGPATLTASTSTPNIPSKAATVTVVSAGAIGLGSNVSVAPGASAPLAVTLPGPAPQAVTVTLSSNSPAIATISPSTVTIAAGQTQPATQPQVSGVNFGAATITASAPGYTSATQTVNVTGSLSLTQNISITGGGTQNMTVALSSAVPTQITVNLSASPAGIVSMPASVTIPANTTSASVQLTGAAAGGTTITATTATTNVSSATAPVTVQPLGAISIPANTVVLSGQSAAFPVVLSTAAPTGGVTVTLSSSDSTIGAVSPTSVSIPAGQTQPATQPQVTAKNLGTANITASSPFYTAATQSVQSVGTASFAPPQLTMTAGDAQNLVLTLSAPAPAGGIKFTVTSNHTNIATVGQGTYTIAATTTTVAVPVSGVGAGIAIIRASAPNMTDATALVTINPRIDINVPPTVSLGPGSTAPFPVSLVNPAQASTTITLTSGDATKATISPASVMIAAGQTAPSQTPTVTGVATGQTTITASATGLNSAVSQITVASMDIIMPPAFTVAPGVQQEFDVALAKPAQAPTVINLSSSNTNAVTISPSSLDIDVGQTQPTRQPNITTLGIGQATITASADGLAPGTTQITVGVTASMTPANLIVNPGVVSALTIALSAPQPSNTTFTLTSQNPGVATVPTAIVLPAGTQLSGFNVTGVANGTSVVTATAPGFAPMTSKVTVQPAGLLSMAISNPNIQLNTSGTITFTLSTPAPAAGLTISVNSDNPAVTLASTLISMQPGDTTASTQYTAVNLGNATITASAAGYTSPTPAVIKSGAVITWDTPTLTATGAGQQVFLFLHLNTTVPPGPTGIPITLISSRPDVATVPPTLSFYWDGNTNPILRIQIDTVGPGTTKIHASGQNIPGVDATVTVTGPLSISTTSLPNGAAGSPYSAPVAAVGGVTPYSWSATGLPSGLSINASTGQITGTTSAIGTASVTINVQDSSSPALTAKAVLSLTINPPAVGSIAVAGGSGQAVPDLTTFASPLSVLVKDGGGNPLSGVTVTFSAPSTGASATFAGGVNTAVTNASGIATSATLTANKTIGGYYVTASAGAVSTRFSLRNTLGVPANLAVTSGSGQTATVNTAFANPLIAILTDAGGNPIANARVTFTAPAQSSASATFAGGVNTALTNASGIATSAALTANAVAGGPYNVVATSATVSGNFALTNTPASAAKVAVTGGNNQSAAINTAFASPLAVTVTDSAGNPVPNVVVTFTAPAQTGPSVTFAGGKTTATTNAAGVATSVTITANSRVGASYSVVASAGPAAPATFTLTNLVGAPAKVVTASPSSQQTVVNTAFASPMIVTVQDAAGNRVPGATVTFTAPSTGATLTFAGGINTAVSDAQGVARSAIVTANTVSGSYSVIASSGAATSAKILMINNAGAAAQITVTSGSGQSAAVNTAFPNPLVATVTDAFGNATPNVHVSFAAPAQSGPSVTFAGGVNVVATDASGIATLPPPIANGNLGGPYNVICGSGSANKVSFALTNVKAPPANIVASSGGGQSATINTAFASPLVAIATDTGGNPVQGAIVTFTAPAASGASVTFSGGVNTAVTDASGKATVSVTANSHAGAYSIVASSGPAKTASFALTNTVGPPANVSITAGSGQSAPVNTAFASPLVVTVTDAGGNPLANTTVTFTPPAATGPSLTFAGGINTAVTNSSGVATSAAITANSHAGPAYTVTAAAGSATASFTLANTVGSVTKVVVTSGSGQTTQVATGFAQPLTATAQDAFGNPVPGAMVTFTPPAQTAASITFAGGSNTALTNASGVATSAAITANNKAGGPYNVVASSGSASTANFSLTNTPGPAAAITASSGSGQTAAVNAAFANPLVAAVTDSLGNPVANMTVTFTTPAQTGPSATFVGGVNTAVTNAQGLATSAPLTANGHLGGPYNVVAGFGGTATANFALTNTFGAAAKIVINSGNSQTATISTAFASPLSVIVTDSSGNPVSGATVTFTAPAQTGASATFAGGVNTAVTNAQGVATSATVSANNFAGAYSVIASCGSASTAAFSLTNQSGPAAKVVVTSGSSQSAQVNTAFANPLVATVTDAGGNPISGAIVTFTAPAQSTASVTFAGSVTTATTNANGVATSAIITANSIAGGPYQVTAATGSATSAAFLLTNKPGPATSLTVSAGSPQQTTVSTAFASPLKVLLTDANNNGISGVTVTFTAPSTGASATFAGGKNTAVTNASGIATSAVLTANSTVGGYLVTASASGLSTAFSLTNVAGTPAAISALSGSGQTTPLNTPFAALKALVTDSGGNPVPGVVVTFTAPANGAGGTFAGNQNTATTDSTGTATAPQFTANNVTGSYTVIASVAGLSSTASFLLTNAAASGATISVTSATVGQNLQAPITITLNPAPPTTGVGVTIESSDSTLALVGTGRAGFTINITPGLNPFSVPVQALVGSGKAVITVSAPGYSSASTEITFAPSGLVIAGPNGVGGSFNVFQGTSTPLTVSAAQLDASGKFVQVQQVRQGFSLTAKATSSNTNLGTVSPTSAAIGAAVDHANFNLLASAGLTGTATLTTVQPSGFTTPTDGSNKAAFTVQQGTMVPFTASVGQFLAKDVSVNLGAPAATPVDLTITSNDPTKLQLSMSPVNPGAASISFTVPPGHDHSQTFYLLGLANSGSVGYTVVSSVLGTVTGTVNLGPSGLAIQSVAGFGASSFSTTLDAGQATLQVFTVLMDGSGNIVEQQVVAGSTPLSISVTSSNTAVGTIDTSPISVAGGSNSATCNLVLASAGTTTVTASATGFASAQVTATVTHTLPPLLFANGDGTIGKNLESQYTVLVPQNTSAGGVQVTIQSNSSLISVSASPTGAGSSSIVLSVPTNTSTATFYVQGLANSGAAIVTGTAAGYQTATANIQLAPSAIVIAPNAVSGNAGASTSAGLFVVVLDSTNTPQATDELIAGSSPVSVPVNSDTPTVASAPTRIAIQPGSGTANVPITLGVPGTATISITEPTGFTTPNSSVSTLVTAN